MLQANRAAPCVRRVLGGAVDLAVQLKDAALGIAQAVARGRWEQILARSLFERDVGGGDAVEQSLSSAGSATSSA